MRFLIDVDGVVAGCMQLMTREINARFRTGWEGLVTKPVKVSDITEFKFFDPSLGILTAGEAKFALANFGRPGFAYDMPVLPGAKSAIKQIEEAEHEVVFVTADWQESKTWVNDRRRWIEEHFGDYEVIFCHKKEMIKGNVLIDDRDITCDQFATENPNGTVLMFNQPWNLNYTPTNDNVVRFKGWHEMPKILGAFNK